MTVDQAKSALALAVTDGYGAKNVWIKEADGTLVAANAVLVDLGDARYFPDVVNPDIICIIEAVQS